MVLLGTPGDRARRRLTVIGPVPGQTNLVTCDGRGRIVVCFNIQEGKGDLRARILALGEYARGQSLGVTPVQVFDREGTGVELFSALVAAQTPFVIWEKDVDRARLAALEADAFSETLRVNATDYRVLEETKACCYAPEVEDSDAQMPAEHISCLP